MKVEKLKRFKRRIAKAKRKCRSELQLHQWNRHRYSEQCFWPKTSKFDTAIRIDYQKTSESEFIEKVESRNVPAVIQNCVRYWKANENWDISSLKERFKSVKFKVGEDDNEKSVLLSFKTFKKYAQEQSDDSPMYIFDSNFADKPVSNQILQDYTVPKYFADDFFKLTGEKRPPFRWFVVGPARSGTGIHVDPLGTSAWNALVYGHKRWVMFPPDTPRQLVDPRGLGDHEGITWFQKVYPTVKDKLKMIELVQRPGEIVFVPAGWYHAVLNLDFTVAVTQNFCSRTNIEYVWLKTRFARPKLAKKLLDEFKKRKEAVYVEMVAKIERLLMVPALFTSDPGDTSESENER